MDVSVIYSVQLPVLRISPDDHPWPKHKVRLRKQQTLHHD